MLEALTAPVKKLSYTGMAGWLKAKDEELLAFLRKT